MITYTYEPAGRRIKKNVVGSYIIKYVYDGDDVIAECDDSGLLRKYIYGARVDEPVCMIDVEDSNAEYYYHFDGLGSVVAATGTKGMRAAMRTFVFHWTIAILDLVAFRAAMLTDGAAGVIEAGFFGNDWSIERGTWIRR